MSYAGGKGGCFRQIINRMPPHRVYIETHLGGGSVFLNKQPAEYSIGIDVDEAVIASWKQRQSGLGSSAPTITADDAGLHQRRSSIAAADGEGLQRQIERCRLEVPVPPRQTQRASGSDGHCGAHALHLVHGDALDFLNGYDWQGDELVYADPPYVMSSRSSGRDIYAHEYSDADHVQLISLLLTLPCQVMLSGYRCELYDQMLSAWRREDFTSATRAGRSATESVWMNFPEGRLHEYTYVGGDYRERERIKRKQKRWEKKFAALPDAERDAMLRTLLKLLPSRELAVAAVHDTFGNASEAGAGRQA